MKGKNEKRKKLNKKKVAIFTSLIAVLTILAGTFAWTSYTEWVKNHMQSRGYEEGRVTIIEKFDPKPIDENPTITKDVKVVNTSSADSFVRISFEEMLHKLASGAEAKGVLTEGDAGFPVIINSEAYTKTGAGYTDITSNVAIKDKDGKPVTKPGNLKVYLSADGNSAGMFLEKAMKVADFPKGFDFLANNAQVPVISGSFAADDAVVAQKVTGKVEKQTDGSYVLYTDKYAKAEENFAIWGYIKGLETAPKEADWAGENVNVIATVAPGTVGESSVDSNIKFKQNPANVSNTDKTKDWFYDTTSGYFYYTKVLKAGATTTSALLESITFPDAKIDQTYKMASYDLFVGLEAIPATKSALKANSNGGKFSGTTPTVEGNKTWESNGFGWGLTENSELYKHFLPLVTIVE